MLWAYAAQLARLAEAPEPPAPTLPPGRVLIRCLKPFRVKDGGSLDPIASNLGHVFAAGAAIMRGERCSLTSEAADVLVGLGRAELVAR